MATVIRAVGSITAGLAVALLLVIGVEIVGNTLHPFPADFDKESHEAMCEHVARFPHWVLAVAAAGWGATALVSTWVARRIGNWICGAIVGLILFAAAAANVAMLPYATWFKVVILIAIPAAIYLGVRGPKGPRAG